METRMLKKSRDGHSFLFKYKPGEEDGIIEYLMRLADDNTSTFNWMDAADLCLEITGMETAAGQG